MKLTDPTLARGGRRGGKRGQVKGFSRGSRRRMLEVMQAVNPDKVAGVFFLTLTARPEHLTWENIEAKRRAWVMRFARQWKPYPHVLIWRKEPHASGAPHLHALVLWLRRVPCLVGAFRPWNDDAWGRVVGDVDASRVGCRSEFIKRWNGVRFYLCKYLAKDSGVEVTGRCWGVVNRAALPITWREAALPRAVAVRVQRALRHLLERRRRGWLWRKPGEERWSRVPAAWLSLLRVPGMRAYLRREGGQLRYFKPRMTYCLADSPEQTFLDPDTGLYEKVDVQAEWGVLPAVRNIAPGTFFVASAAFARVVDWSFRRHLEELEQVKDLPF